MSEQTRFARLSRKMFTHLHSEYQQLRVTSHQAKAEDANNFCDKLVAKGVISVAQQPDYLSMLLRLDNVSRVHKYSENGVTRKVSAYEAKKAELLKRTPVFTYGERIGKAGPGAKSDGTAEAAKVRTFAAAVLPDHMREQYVETFCELQKKKPRLTAAEYGAQ